MLALVAAFGTQAALAQERPAAFVDAATVVPGLIVEMRYAGAHNFVGRPIDGYEAPRCLLTKPAANALAGVAKDVAAYGLVIKVFDCYRPTRAVANFVRWARDLKDTAGKAEFYPDVDKRTLFRDGYIASQSGHSRGSTIDLTLAHADGRELDMGTPFDFFSTKSWPNSAGVSHDCDGEPRRAGIRHAAQRLSALRARMVALHAARRAVSGYLFRFSGQVRRVAVTFCGHLVVAFTSERNIG